MEQFRSKLFSSALACPKVGKDVDVEGGEFFDTGPLKLTAKASENRPGPKRK